MPKLTEDALRRAFTPPQQVAPWQAFWATVVDAWPLTVRTDEPEAEPDAEPVPALGFGAYAPGARVYCLLVNEDLASASQRVVVIGQKYDGPQ